MRDKADIVIREREDEREERRSEAGNISLIVTGIMVGLLGILALTLDLGTMYVGQNQLQKVADASARAALASLSKASAQSSGPTVLEQAESAARQIAQQSSVIQGGVKNADIDVQFGRFDFDTKQFVQDVSGMVRPPAVRVVASRRGESAGDSSGALRVMTRGKNVNVSASSVAAQRCRNIVIATDVSASFAESIGEVENAISAVVQRIANSKAPDEVALLAFRNIVVNQTESGGRVSSDRLVSADSLLASGQINRLDGRGVSCPIPRNTLQVPGCAGTDIRQALVRAGDLFQEKQTRSTGNTCENMLLLVSDGEPCQINGGLLDAVVALLGTDLIGPPNRTGPNEQRGGGSSKAEINAARNDLVNNFGVSIATIAVNTGGAGDGERCLLRPNEPGGELFNPPTLIRVGSDESFLRIRRTSQDDRFLEQMVAGFGSKFDSADISRDRLAESMDRALASVPPVTVEEQRSSN